MAFFHNLHRNIDFTSTESEKFDIISALPVEISSKIFGMLDPNSMFAAMSVCTTWHHLYQGNRLLRRSLKKKARAERERRMLFIHNLDVKPTDSGYRHKLPKARLQVSNDLNLKRKRTSIREPVQGFKHLRM